MPDVGILNLQIHDDSAKAAEGLSKLVAKLEEMKNATSKIRLGTVATGIKRINDELSKVQPSAIYKLKQLADVLEKIGSISGNVGGIRISFGGKGQSAEEINASMQAAKEAAAQTSSMFESIGQRIQEDVTGVRGFAGEVEKLNNLVQQTGWTAQSTAEQFAQMFQVANSIRMSGALGGGASPFALGDGTGGSGAQWVEWKDGAIEVEGTVTEAMDAIRIGANDAIIPMSGIVESASEMTSSFETVESSVQNISSNADQIKSMATGFEDVAQSTRDAARETANYYKSLEDAFYGIRNGQKIENDLMSKWLHGEGTENEKLYAIKTMATQFGMSTDDVRAKIAELMAAENGLTGAAQETTDAMNSINGAADEQKKSLKELIIGANGLNGAFKRMFPTLSGLLGRFGQLVKYRMLRAVIKQIAEGFREGTENYYRYSQAIGGEFATKMDNAATALLQMKNSIGAAAAPLISSLIPYLQMAVDWFINIVNYANQFVALLRGQATWSRATKQSVKAFDDTKKAAKGAGAAMKDLLADWDELNIIQSEGGGSSGGSGVKAMEDYLNMFEEVNRFDNGVSKVVEHIKENMDDIARMAAIAGAAILGWKVSDAFGGILGKLGGTLGTLATVALTVELSDQFGQLYTKTGDVGWFIADTLTGAIGSTLAWKVAKKVAGNQAAYIAAGFTLTLSGLVNMKNAISAAAQGKLAEWGMLSILSAAETGVGTALIAKGLSLPAAFSFGLGAAAAIATVAINVGALIQMSKDNIEWGKVTLTPEAVIEFVQNKMFSGVDVPVLIQKIDADLSQAKVNKENIRTQLTEMIPTMYAIRLGINKKASYDELKKQLFGDEQSGTAGLISLLETEATSNVHELKTAFAIVPVISGAGNDVTAQYLESGISGWGEVSSYVHDLGTKLGQELSKGFTEDGIAKFDEEAVREMTEKLRRISEILTGSQAQAAATSGLRMGLEELGLGDLTQESVNEVVKLFGNYQDELRRSYTDIYTDAAKQYLVLANYYREQGNAGLADSYLKQYNDLIHNLPQSVNAALMRSAGPGFDMIYEFLHDKFGKVFEKISLNLDDGGSGALRQALLAQFKPTEGDVQRTVQDFSKAMMSIYGGENMFLSGLLAQMPDINILDLLTYGMNEQDLNEAKANIKEMLTGLYGSDVANEIIDAWEKSHITEEVQEAVESMPTVEAEQEAMQTELPVEIEPVPEIVGAETTESFDFDADVGVVDVPVEFSISTEGQQALRDAIESAMSDGMMDTSEAMDLMAIYGWDNYENMLKELQHNLDEEARNQQGPMNIAVDEVNVVAENINTEEVKNAVKNALGDLEITDNERTSLIAKYGENAYRQAVLGIMNEMSPNSNVDLANRPKVQLDNGDYATLLTETFTAGKEGIEWGEDVILNITPILPDGTILDDNAMNNYVEELLGKSRNVNDLFWNDKPENGGLGLLIQAFQDEDWMDMFDDFDQAVRWAEERAIKLHELQEELYEDENVLNRGKLRPVGYLASAGVSDVGGGRPDLYRPVVTPEPEDDQKQVNNTATGVQKGVSGLYDALQSILRVAEAINRKEFKVNITPSASWGNHNSKSNSAWDRVTGNA